MNGEMILYIVVGTLFVLLILHLNHKRRMSYKAHKFYSDVEGLGKYKATDEIRKHEIEWYSRIKIAEIEKEKELEAIKFYQEQKANAPHPEPEQEQPADGFWIKDYMADRPIFAKYVKEES